MLRSAGRFTTAEARIPKPSYGETSTDEVSGGLRRSAERWNVYPSGSCRRSGGLRARVKVCGLSAEVIQAPLADRHGLTAMNRTSLSRLGLDHRHIAATCLDDDLVALQIADNGCGAATSETKRGGNREKNFS
jgi:hypothetical protein